MVYGETQMVYGETQWEGVRICRYGGSGGANPIEARL